LDADIDASDMTDGWLADGAVRVDDISPTEGGVVSTEDSSAWLLMDDPRSGSVVIVEFLRLLTPKGREVWTAWAP